MNESHKRLILAAQNDPYVNHHLLTECGISQIGNRVVVYYNGDYSATEELDLPSHLQLKYADGDAIQKEQRYMGHLIQEGNTRCGWTALQHAIQTNQISDPNILAIHAHWQKEMSQQGIPQEVLDAVLRTGLQNPGPGEVIITILPLPGFRRGDRRH